MSFGGGGGVEFSVFILFLGRAFDFVGFLTLDVPALERDDFFGGIRNQ